MNSEGFNIWFPALVGGLVVGLLVAALWDVLRRKTWCFASRFWPGVLKEVGLENSCLSRAEVEEKQREVTDMLSSLSTQITRALVPVEQSMAEAAQYSSSSGSSYSDVICKFDLESQAGNNPAYTPLTFTATAYFPDDTPSVVIRPTKKFFKRYAKGTVKRWRSSIILQAPMPIEPCVLAEIGELARNCMLEDNRCVFQLGNWAILYYNVGEVHLHILKEGDVPVNVEARWQPERTDITMRGLYLNGAQVKVATKHTSTILRSDGPAIQGAGDLDELHLPTEEVDFRGEDSFIYASKVVEADGISLLVRSEACFILPPRGTFALIEALCGQLQRISIFAKETINFFLQAEDRQPETTANLSELRFDHEHLELIVEHWNGVSEIELLDYRKEVLYYLQELQASGIVERAGPPSLDSHLIFIRDEHYLEYWQGGLQVLNKVIHRNSSDSHSRTHISIRGGIKFLLGDFEGALQDLDLAYLKIGGHRSTVLLDRALVKCMLGRYSEGMHDVVTFITLSPNVNDIQELQTCIQQILDQQRSFRIVAQSGPLCQRSLLPDQDNSMVEIPDLLTEDERHLGASESFRPVSDDGTAGGSTFDPPSKRAKSMGLCSNPTAVERQDDSKQFHGICLSENRNSPWIAEVAAADANGLNRHRGSEARTNPRMSIPANCKPHTSRQIMSRSGREPGTSQFYGVRFRPDLKKWVAEIRVAEWKAVDKKVWLGTFDTEQAAARAVDLARKLVKCRKKRRPNLPCEKLEAYSRQIPPQLTLTDLTDTMFKQVTLFIKRECQEYAASLDDTPGEQITLAFDEHDSCGGQFLNPTSSVNPAAQGYENMLPPNSSDVLNVGVHSESDFPDMSLDLTDLTRAGFEVAPAGTSFPTSNDNGCNKHRWSDARTNPRMRIQANNKPQTPPQTLPRSSCKAGVSHYYGVRFRPDLKKWVAEIRVAEWKAVDKKVWLGTFDTEQAAARAVDLARKLVKCRQKRRPNFPCEKLEAYSRQIPPQLTLTDLTDTMFKQVTLFIKRECQEYAASFDDERFTLAQLLNPTSSVNPAAHGYENMPPHNSSDVLNVDVHSESDFPDMILDLTDLTCAMRQGQTPRLSIPANCKPHTSRQILPRSGREPGTSQYYGVRFRPDLKKWVAEIRVAEWKAVDKKVWLGTFDTEQAAARAVDLARKLVKCRKKCRPNLLCEKLEAYSRQIPPQLILTDLTDTSMFKQVTLFIKRECQEYAASFDDSPGEQITPALDQHFELWSVNPAAPGYENMPPPNISDVLNVDVHSESKFSDMILELCTGYLEGSPAGARKLEHPNESDPRLLHQGFFHPTEVWDDFVQVGDEQELNFYYFAEQVGCFICSILGEQLKSINPRRTPQTLSPQTLSVLGMTSWKSVGWEKTFFHPILFLEVA